MLYRSVPALLLCCQLLSACVAGLPQDHAAVLASTTAERRPEEGSLVVEGPPIHFLGVGTKSSYRIRSWINPAKAGLHDRFQIVARLHFAKRVFLQQAFADGRTLDTTVIDRERLGPGETVETIGINLSQEEMRHYAAAGIGIEISGRRTSVAFAIPAAYLAAVLEAHERAKSTDRGQPVSSPALPAGAASTAPEDAIARQVPG